MGGRRMTRADAAASRKEVAIGEFSFLIRKLASDEMLSLGFIPYAVATGEVTDERAARKAAFGPDLAGRVNGVIAAAVLEPRVWTGAPEACPPDYVWVGDLGDVRDELVAAIYDHSKLKEDLERAARFRDPGGLGGDPLPASNGGGDAAVDAPRNGPAIEAPA
jgi:hypothetical protein